MLNKICTAFVALALSAVPPIEPYMVWHGQGITVHAPCSSNMGVQTLPILFRETIHGKRQTLVLPSAGAFPMYWEGSAWSLGHRRVTDPKTKVPYIEGFIHKSDDFLTWEKLGDYRVPLGSFRYINPIGEDRFVGICHAGHVVTDGHFMGPAAVWKFRNGEFQLERVLDLGIPASVWSSSRKVEGHVRRYQVDDLPKEWQRIAIMQLAGNIKVTSDGFVLIDKHLGVFWIFDLTGKFIKEAHLYPSFSKDMDLLKQGLRYFRYDQPVLVAQPLQDGTILVAAQSLEKVMSGELLYPIAPTPGGSAKERTLMDRLRRLRHEIMPNIDYFVLNVASGTLHDVSTPRGAPKRLLTHGQLDEFTFRIGPDGQVVVGPGH